MSEEACCRNPHARHPVTICFQRTLRAVSDSSGALGSLGSRSQRSESCCRFACHDVQTSADIRTRAEAKIADIEAKIRTLESMKKILRKLTRVCDGCAPVSECPILESLDREDI
jgi:hypothetical protein